MYFIHINTYVLTIFAKYKSAYTCTLINFNIFTYFCITKQICAHLSANKSHNLQTNQCIRKYVHRYICRYVDTKVDNNKRSMYLLCSSGRNGARHLTQRP